MPALDPLQPALNPLPAVDPRQPTLMTQRWRAAQLQRQCRRRTSVRMFCVCSIEHRGLRCQEGQGLQKLNNLPMRLLAVPRLQQRERLSMVPDEEV